MRDYPSTGRTNWHSTIGSGRNKCFFFVCRISVFDNKRNLRKRERERDKWVRLFEVEWAYKEYKKVKCEFDALSHEYYFLPNRASQYYQYIDTKGLFFLLMGHGRIWAKPVRITLTRQWIGYSKVNIRNYAQLSLSLTKKLSFFSLQKWSNWSSFKNR